MKSKIQNPKSKIVIVGAGPAGASLAIRLAKKNFEVCLIEREKFPRQKLCGEFISPECFEHFRELDILSEMLAAGGERIVETVFYAPGGKCVNVPSEWFDADDAGALSLSRAEMDLRLMKKAGELGVKILEETSIVDLLIEKNEVRGVKVRAKNGAATEISADLTIDATGRARILGKLAEKLKVQGSKFKVQNSKSENANRLVGFKTHLRNVELDKNRCEIYFFRGGYGGLSLIENGSANFCFLIRAAAVREFSSDVKLIFENVIFQNRRARAALENAEPIYDWLAVSIDNFGSRELSPLKNLFAVGDAGAFIDPFTGSGMLMAFESAEILAKIIVENQFSGDEIAAVYKFRHKAKFQKRLRVCAALRRAAFNPAIAAAVISVLSFSESARAFLTRATRRSFSSTGNQPSKPTISRSLLD